MTRDEIYVSVVLPPENEISIKQSAVLIRLTSLNPAEPNGNNVYQPL
jgi:hypothetical protein